MITKELNEILPPSTTPYTVKVKAIGDLEIYRDSEWSNEVSVLVNQYAKVKNVTINGSVLSWDYVIGGNQYKVQWSSDNVTFVDLCTVNALLVDLSTYASTFGNNDPIYVKVTATGGGFAENYSDVKTLSRSDWTFTVDTDWHELDNWYIGMPEEDYHWHGDKYNQTGYLNINASVRLIDATISFKVTSNGTSWVSKSGSANIVDGLALGKDFMVSASTVSNSILKDVSVIATPYNAWYVPKTVYTASWIARPQLRISTPYNKEIGIIEPFIQPFYIPDYVPYTISGTKVTVSLNDDDTSIVDLIIFHTTAYQLTQSGSQYRISNTLSVSTGHATGMPYTFNFADIHGTAYNWGNYDMTMTFMAKNSWNTDENRTLWIPGRRLTNGQGVHTKDRWFFTYYVGGSSVSTSRKEITN